MKRLQKIKDSGTSTKLKDLLNEIVPNQKIEQIQLSNNKCKNGHWELQEYIYKGKKYKRLVWVCD